VPICYSSIFKDISQIVGWWQGINPINKKSLRALVFLPVEMEGIVASRNDFLYESFLFRSCHCHPRKAYLDN
jgi:hypothetical protein